MIPPSQGLSSGFAAGEDESYNVYDKPWRAGGGAAEKIYRPSKTMDRDIYGDDVEKLIKTSRCVCVCVCGWVGVGVGARAHVRVRACMQWEEMEFPIMKELKDCCSKHGHAKCSGIHSVMLGKPPGLIHV